MIALAVILGAQTERYAHQHTLCAITGTDKIDFVFPHKFLFYSC
jgi:hypothetical protein